MVTPSQTVTPLRLAVKELAGILEELTKLAVAAVGFSYLVGLLVVNIYLWGLGTSEFDLLKIRFVYTGAIVLVWLLLTMFLLGMFVAIETASRDEPVAGNRILRQFQLLLQKRGGGAALSVFLAILCFCDPLWFANRLLTGHYWPIDWHLIKLLFSTYRQCLWVSAVTCFVWLVKSGKADRLLFLSTEHDRRISIAVLTFTAIVSFTFYLRTFAHQVYPILPEQAGGGKPRQVQLLFSPEHSRIAGALGVPLCGSSGLTDSVRLIFEGDTRIVVEVNHHGTMLELRKELIEGIKSPSAGCGTH